MRHGPTQKEYESQNLFHFTECSRLATQPSRSSALGLLNGPHQAICKFNIIPCKSCHLCFFFLKFSNTTDYNFCIIQVFFVYIECVRISCSKCLKLKILSKQHKKITFNLVHILSLNISKSSKVLLNTRNDQKHFIQQTLFF